MAYLLNFTLQFSVCLASEVLTLILNYLSEPPESVANSVRKKRNWVQIIEIAMTVDSRHKYQTPSSSSSTNKMWIKKAELAYMLLWLFMLLAWSAILIGE